MGKNLNISLRKYQIHISIVPLGVSIVLIFSIEIYKLFNYKVNKKYSIFMDQSENNIVQSLKYTTYDWKSNKCQKIANIYII